jgi:hypothetical protein
VNLSTSGKDPPKSPPESEFSRCAVHRFSRALRPCGAWTAERAAVSPGMQAFSFCMGVSNFLSGSGPVPPLHLAVISSFSIHVRLTCNGAPKLPFPTLHLRPWVIAVATSALFNRRKGTHARVSLFFCFFCPGIRSRRPQGRRFRRPCGLSHETGEIRQRCI